MDVRYTPEMLVAYFARLKGLDLKDIDVAPTVVLSWSPGIVSSLVDSIGASLSLRWIDGKRYPLYNGEVDGRRVSISSAMLGAPGAVMQMEQFIACGVRTFIGVGYAGSLQPSAPIGTFFIPTTCVREEGTSVHYIGSNDTTPPSQRLVETLHNSCETLGARVMLGPLWTTDAPFRELIVKIEQYGQQGVLGVDMETSAMYALGIFRSVQVCNLLMVSDELWREWHIALDTPELRKTEQVAQEVILHCLGHLSS
jgi:uridine phosphorylase